MDGQTIPPCVKELASKHGNFPYHEVKTEPPVIRRRLINDDGVSIFFDHKNNSNTGLMCRRPYGANESLRLSDILRAVPLNTSTDASNDQKMSINVLREVRLATSAGVSNQLKRDSMNVDEVKPPAASAPEPKQKIRRDPIKVPCLPVLSTSNSDVDSSEESSLQNEESTDDESNDEFSIVPFSVSITPKIPQPISDLESEDLEESENVKDSCGVRVCENCKTEVTEAIKTLEIEVAFATNKKNLPGTKKKLSLVQNSKEKKESIGQLQSTTFDFLLPQTPKKPQSKSSLFTKNDQRRMLRSYSAQFFTNTPETFPKLRPLSAITRVADRKRVVPNIINFQSSNVLQGHSLSVSKQALHTFNYMRSLKKQEKKRFEEFFGTAVTQAGNMSAEKQKDHWHPQMTIRKTTSRSSDKPGRAKTPQQYRKQEIQNQSVLRYQHRKSSTNTRIVDDYLDDVQYSFRLSMFQTKKDILDGSPNSDDKDFQKPKPALDDNNVNGGKEKLNERPSFKPLNNKQNHCYSRSSTTQSITFRHPSSLHSKSEHKKTPNNNKIIETTSSKQENTAVVRPTRQVLSNTAKEKHLKNISRTVSYDKANINIVNKRNISSAPPQRQQEKIENLSGRRTRPSTATSRKPVNSLNPKSLQKRGSLSSTKSNRQTSAKVEKIQHVEITPAENAQSDLQSSNKNNVSKVSTDENVFKNSNLEQQQQQQLSFTPRNPEQKKKRYRSNRRKPPVTMVSRIKQNNNPGTTNDKIKKCESSSHVVEELKTTKTTAAQQEEKKVVRFQLNQQQPSVELNNNSHNKAKIKPVKKSELDTYFAEREMTNSIVSDECSDILAKLAKNNITVSMETLKRALMKPRERTSEGNESNSLTQSDSRLIARLDV